MFTLTYTVTNNSSFINSKLITFGYFFILYLKYGQCLYRNLVKLPVPNSQNKLGSQFVTFPAGTDKQLFR